MASWIAVPLDGTLTLDDLEGLVTSARTLGVDGAAEVHVGAWPPGSEGGPPVLAVPAQVTVRRVPTAPRDTTRTPVKTHRRARRT